MPAPSPYRSRLFQSVHHHSVRTARRAQRAWREIVALTSLGAKAIAYSFQRMWKIVEASHLQMPAAPHQARLGSGSDSESHYTYSSSKALARVLSVARSLPLLGDDDRSIPLKAPQLQSLPKSSTRPRPGVLALTQQSELESNTGTLARSQRSQVSAPVAIRGIASDLANHHLLLVTRRNEVLDCLTDQQQAKLSFRIKTELELLASAPPSSVSITTQPLTWQDSISRLALPARRLHKLPAATERLLQAPIERLQQLSEAASHHPLSEPLRELVTRIPSPQKATARLAKLALPPAQQTVDLTAQVAAHLSNTIGGQLAKLPLPPGSPTSSALAPIKPSVADWELASSNVSAWKDYLQQQFHQLWSQTLQDNLLPSRIRKPLHVEGNPILEALPLMRSAWASRLLKPFRRQSTPWPDLNAVKQAEAPMLPPSPAQLLLKPATIGFLRPAARGNITLSRTPQETIRDTNTRNQVNDKLLSGLFQSSEQALAGAYPFATLPMGDVAIPSSTTVSSNTVSPSTISSSTKKVSRQRNNSRPQNKRRSNLKRRKQRQAVTNTYIDVQATDLGHDPSVVSQGIHWLDRGVYALEESALKAWQWWCELVEPEGAPKPINTIGATHEGRELLVAGTRKSQDIVIAGTELGVALFQELWPLMWHLVQVLTRKTSKVAVQILQWTLTVALPAILRAGGTVVKTGVERMERSVQERKESRK